MSILIGVAAHVSRTKMANALADSVEADVLNVDYTDATAFEDRLAACVANHLTVLRLLQERRINERWVIVLEDDALPIGDFRLQAELALDYARAPVVGFYIGRSGAALNLEALTDAWARGKAWAEAHHMISAVAYAIRANHLVNIIAGFDGAPGVSVEAHITRWAHSNMERFNYTIPSLVDHATVDSIVTPDNRDADIRRAWKVGVAASWDTSTVEYDPTF